MLNHFGKIYLSVECIDRPKDVPPVVYLEIFNRESRELIGTMRVCYDPHYSVNRCQLRIAFDVLDIKDIDPTYNNTLEDIVMAGFAFCKIDNHHIYDDFNITPYMVINQYPEDPMGMKMINAKIVEILIGMEFETGGDIKNKFVFTKKSQMALSKALVKKYLLN